MFPHQFLFLCHFIHVSQFIIIHISQSLLVSQSLHSCFSITYIFLLSVCPFVFVSFPRLFFHLSLSFFLSGDYIAPVSLALPLPPSFSTPLSVLLSIFPLPSPFFCLSLSLSHSLYPLWMIAEFLQIIYSQLNLLKTYENIQMFVFILI